MIRLMTCRVSTVRMEIVATRKGKSTLPYHNYQSKIFFIHIVRFGFQSLIFWFKLYRVNCDTTSLVLKVIAIQLIPKNDLIYSMSRPKKSRCFVAIFYNKEKRVILCVLLPKWWLKVTLFGFSPEISLFQTLFSDWKILILTLIWGVSCWQNSH